jgi:putative protein kinase ArgK-like GTPase of G3E family
VADAGPATPAAPFLIVTGPMGVGKSTVAEAVSDALRTAGVPHALVDLDAFTGCYPPPPDDPYRQRLALRNLAAV